MRFLLFIVCLISLVRILHSVLPSPYKEWSKQRLIRDFTLSENSSQVYVAATYLYHLTEDLQEQEISALENNEVTATNVVVSPDQNTGFACSDLTGKCFTFNLSDVRQFSLPTDLQLSIPEPFDNFAMAPILGGLQSVTIGLAKNSRYPIIVNSIPTFPNVILTSLNKVFLGEATLTNTPTRNYLTIFTYGDYIYYVIRHEMPKNIGTPVISTYLIRTCQSESSQIIESIVEVELSPCDNLKVFPQTASMGVWNASHSQVIAVTFTTSESATDSVLCLYSQLDIDSAVSGAIQACFAVSDSVSYRLPWTTLSSVSCSTVGAPASVCRLCSSGIGVCHLSDYTGINGTQLTGFDSSFYNKITALSLISIDETDLAFIGTVNGKLLKYQLTNSILLSLIEDIDLNQLLETSFSKIIPDNRVEYLYASRDSLLYRVDLINCRAYTSCDSCVDTIDPVCGYCSLSETCTRKSDCANADLPLRWITDNSSNCLSLNSITPMLAQVGETIQIDVDVSNLPKLESPHTYECVFEQHTTSVTNISVPGLSLDLTGPDNPGTVSINCLVPPTYMLNNDYQQINFSLRSTELALEFAEQVNDFTFYNCSFHTRCEPCTNSLAPCNWCLYDNLCTHSEANCNFTYVLPENNSSSCPSLTNTTDLSVHNGTTAVDVLELRARNMPQPTGSYQYSCSYQINSMMVTLPGTWNGSELVECAPPPLIYAVEGTVSAPFSLIWGLGGYDVDEDNINVTIFNCERFEQDCSSCFGFGGLFGCGPCYRNTSRMSDPTCRLERQCSEADFVFIDPSQPSCPDPFNITFTPRGGRIDGGNPVTITGENLGGSQEDLSVTVANVSCQITSYDIVEKTLICITGKLTSNSSTGPVTVTVQGSLTVTSTEIFQYLNPMVSSVQTYLHTDPMSDVTHPDSVLRGVFAGGTLLEIIGANLGAGANVSVDITESQLQCEITNKDQIINTPDISFITCLTTNNSERIPGGIITVVIDGTRHLYQGGVFTYSDLSIDAVSPQNLILAGGIPVILTVTDAQSLHRPELALVNGNGDIVERMRCENVSETGNKKAQLICESPPTSNPEHILELKVDNLVIKLPGLTFQPNPTCSEDVQYSDSILIKGSGFDHVSQDLYTISINSSTKTILCGIFRFQNEEIECFPGEKVAGTLFIQIGRNHQCTFSNPIEPEFSLFERYGTIILGSSGGLLALIVILVLILILIFIIVIGLYRYKKLREVKGIIDKYYKMESTLAKEFKTGFAELQVEIVEFVQAAETNDIPFTDFQDYILKLIFKREQDVMFLTKPGDFGSFVSHKSVEPEQRKRAVKLFQELLNNKEFLVELIRVFDQNSSLDINQKSYFAALIMIAVHKNLFYATEILKILIDDLISKTRFQHQQLKTLFRGTSVCEKLLSNWLAFCLYNYLRGKPGEELYKLYSAIKLQISKGPIDAITFEAKYSLNEDNILRMSFDVKEFEILCHFADTSDSIKLLDCDTVTQVKRKIIDALNKNMSASQKPDPETLELIFVKPRTISQNQNPKHELEVCRDSGEGLVVKNPIYSPGDETLAREIPTLSKVKQPYILLRDIDKTSGTENGWKRINTMKHYFSFYNIAIPQNGSLLLVRIADIQDRFPSLYTDLMRRKSTETPPRIYHLHFPENSESPSVRQKVISEVYYTKLLSTKGILQKYIDSMMDSIFPDRTVTEECPKPIKHLFDYLEARARFYGISDAEVVQTWKNNSVVLRFWVNLLKNPDFILDIDIPVPVDASLSTIAQGLIDSCSTQEQELTKDSPANKLLFAKDTKVSKKRVKKYYEDIHYLTLPRYNFNQHLRQMQLTNSPFFVDSAAQEIYMRWIAGTSVIRSKLLTRLREKNLESQVTKFTQILKLMSDPELDFKLNK